MDQLKVILKHLKKQHFWLLSVAALLTGIIGWTMARGALSSAYEQKKGAIVGKFSSLDGIRNTENPPNHTWTEGIEQLTKQEKATVEETWTKLYGEQKKVLEWPKHLGTDFLKLVSEHDNNYIIPPNYCELYQNYIKEYFPQLPAIIDAEPVTAAKQQAGTGLRGGMAAQKQAAATGQVEPTREFKMIWDSESQQGIQQSLEWPGVPSSKQVRLAQEDLWVYSALLHMIHAANEGAAHTPRIKRISGLVIGKPAADSLEKSLTENRIEKLAAPAGAGEAIPDAGAAAAGAPVEGVVAEPDDNRYVDAEGKKITGAVAAANPFKRIPVHMRLNMDQREVTRLLVECANAPLPLEVRQLRINTDKGKGSSMPSASAPSGGGGGGGGGLRGAVGLRGAAAGGQAAASTTGTSSDNETYDVPVEIYGIVYMYNPPNMNATPEAAPAAAIPAATAAPAASAPGRPKSFRERAMELNK